MALEPRAASRFPGLAWPHIMPHRHNVVTQSFDKSGLSFWLLHAFPQTLVTMDVVSSNGNIFFKRILLSSTKWYLQQQRWDSTTTTPALPPEPSTCPEPLRNHHWNLQNLHRNHVKARSLQPMRSGLKRNLFRTASEPSGTRATAEPPRNLHQNHPGTCTISCTEP